MCHEEQFTVGCNTWPINFKILSSIIKLLPGTIILMKITLFLKCNWLLLSALSMDQCMPIFLFRNDEEMRFLIIRSEVIITFNMSFTKLLWKFLAFLFLNHTEKRLKIATSVKCIHLHLKKNEKAIYAMYNGEIATSNHC